MLRHILFDLDNTLYSQDSGLWEAIGHRINLYMIERVGIHPDIASDRREHYFRSYGTTFNALRRYHGVDAHDFFTFVHDLPLEDHLAPEPELDGMLERLPLEKVIFSNSDAAHVERVLNRLGVARHFSRIIDIFTLELINKPDIRAYKQALRLISARPEECVLVEDSPANLLPAKELGMKTVLVGKGERPDGADCQIPRITLLEPLLHSMVLSLNHEKSALD